MAVRHPGKETCDVAGCVWDNILGAAVWIFPELWLGCGRQVSVGTTEWKPWCSENLCVRSKILLFYVLLSDYSMIPI